MNRIYIPLEALEAYGESTGRSLPIGGTVRGRQVELRLRSALRSLRKRRDSFHERFTGTAMPEGARWLLDNFYLAQREGLDCCAAFHRAGRLPAAEGEALILALCRGLLNSGGGAADEERCRVFLTGFQKKTVLSSRELGLFAPALRAAAILQLASLYEEDDPAGEAVGALFGVLRLWSTLELTALLEQVDRTEQILRQDPAEIYPLMDESSRQAYRQQVQRLARQRGIPEHRAAMRAVRLAKEGSDERTRHVGYHLYVRPLGDAPRPRTGGGYIALNILLPVGLSLLAAFALRSPWAALLLWLPIWQAVKTVTDTLLSRWVSPRHLPRLALKDGVPETGRTVCVISTLLTAEAEADTAVRRMEEFHHASHSCGRALTFGLLCDLPEAEQARTEADRRLLKHAADAVDTLNRRYGGGFYLFFRERSWSRDTGRFTGWERKRGALLELGRWLAGEKSSMQILSGDPRRLKGTRYILTLDADTRLLPDSARQLIGAAMHPLNRPVIDRNRHLVVAGHGVIQTRIATELTAAQATPFTRLFAPQGGTDPYGGDAGEVYMDLFESGGFAGKGILDVQALLLCMDKRLPENTVLSHDALEGAFLRGGLMSDTELTDGFPGDVLSYYKRLHRWVRGDWQNAPWLFRKGRELPAIEKWRLFDSLRRSLTPGWTLAALLAGFFLPGSAMTWVSLLALGCFCLPLLLSLLQAALQPEELTRLRLLSGVYHGVSAALMKTGVELLLLPWEAWICLSAGATALWRMLISRKNLLVWQTAAQAAGKGAGLLRYYKTMAPAAALGAICLLFSAAVTGRAAGLLWLASPALAAALSRQPAPAAVLTAADRDWLKSQAGAIWRYYRDFCTKEEHYLPPDNFQDAPPVGLAHRTSPTNMGLGLIAALCAMDLELAPRQEALDLMENMLTTLESLPKWNGHLYNWYDTRTAQPLKPKYVSTVDSGNLAGCLLVLQYGLTEYHITKTAKRAENLRSAMDFRPLYDEKRHLFRIGLEPEDPAPAKSWYDLMESEERLTGYLTVASGQVPKKHWSRLSRAQVGCDGFRGMASWTGTMFEYLMPELFLPLYRDSLLYESARFALYVQRRRTAGTKKVWGSSESAFYALDAGLNYRYKAHGCPRLALCRGMEEELVISPYSSFLALKISPRAALKNLRALEEMGMTGPYGFWEAADFSPARCDETGSIVRCVMAHHLGMSLAAITNALREDILPRRFMADAAMAAYAPLLQEKVPLGGLLLRRREKTAPPRRRFESGSPRRKEGTGIDWVNPVCTALSNGVYSLLLTESGLSQSRCANLMPYKSPRLPLGDGQGMEILFQQGEERFSLLPDPRQEDSFCWHLTGGEAGHSGCGPGLNWNVTAKVSRLAAGELRQITLRRENPRQEGRLQLRFEPVLAPEGDYRSQPAFCRLGLEIRERDGILRIRRLPRGKQGELHMALACSEPALYSADSRMAPRRGSRTGAISPNAGWQSESCVTAEVILPPGREQAELCFALCVASTEEEACRGAQRMLTEPEGFDMARAAAAALGLTEESADAALDMLPALVFPHVSQEGAALPVAPRNELWALGISGDLPIAAVECAGDEAMAPAEEQLKRHGLLSACGILYDLVFLTDDGGEYLQPRRSALESAARHLGRDTAIGARGGVHFAPLEQRALFQSAAALYGRELPEPRQPRRSMPLPPHRSGETAPPAYAWARDGSFTLGLKGILPPRSWGNLLTNGQLSWFAADSGTGALWLDNARECPLTPWRGDPLAEEGPETLWVEHKGQLYSFFARNGEESRLTFAPGSAMWEKTLPGLSLRLTALIPPGHNVRIFRLESSEPCTVRWCAPLQLAAETVDAAACSVSCENGIFRADNPRSVRPGLQFQAGCSAPWLETATDAGRWAVGEPHSPRRCGQPGFAGSFRLENEAVLVCGTEDVRPWLAPEAARAALEETKLWWQNRVFTLTAETPDRDLNRLLQGWAAYQALACRCMGRSSQYQSGGAMGFRDQLQDRVNLIPIDPKGCREHILVSCAHQFREGDVQHWWHPAPGSGADKGVRTRCSDDLLWLPWAVCEYVEQTGDESLCAETAPWLRSPPLSPGEDSRYETPEQTRETGSVLAHCRRALELILVRGVGQHELLLMGSGDWNDGFDAMGEGAESVWLSWFFSIVAHKFAGLLGRLGEPDGEKYERAARALGRSADRAWDGDCYLRGYYGDGTPLGSRDQSACRIDSLAQSFASFCPYADGEKVDRALDTALAELWNRKDELVRLYAPSFTGSERAPGYVSGYGPGFRENGGQYTHAALWLAMACFRRNRRAEGAALLRCACASQRDTEIYGAEPFVIPADIYAGDKQGRAGWSWYTGSAGWFFSVAFRELLGFRLKDGKPELDPRLPEDWPGYTGRWVDSQGREHRFGIRDGEAFLS